MTSQNSNRHVSQHFGADAGVDDAALTEAFDRELGREASPEATALALQTVRAPAFTPAHWRAVDAISLGVETGAGVMALVGPDGAERARTAEEAARALPGRFKSLFLGPDGASFDGLLRALARALAVDPAVGDDRNAAAKAVRERLESVAKRGRGVALFIDSPDQLEPLAENYLGRLAALGRRVTRLAALDHGVGRGQGAGEKSSDGASVGVGPAVILVGRPDMRAHLCASQDPLLRRAGEGALHLRFFRRAEQRAFLLQSVAAIDADAEAFAFEVTGGCPRLLSDLLVGLEDVVAARRLRAGRRQRGRASADSALAETGAPVDLEAVTREDVDLVAARDGLYEKAAAIRAVSGPAFAMARADADAELAVAEGLDPMRPGGGAGGLLGEEGLLGDEEDAQRTAALSRVSRVSPSTPRGGDGRDRRGEREDGFIVMEPHDARLAGEGSVEAWRTRRPFSGMVARLSFSLSRRGRAGKKRESPFGDRARASVTHHPGGPVRILSVVALAVATAGVGYWGWSGGASGGGGERADGAVAVETADASYTLSAAGGGGAAGASGLALGAASSAFVAARIGAETSGGFEDGGPGQSGVGAVAVGAAPPSALLTSGAAAAPGALAAAVLRATPALAISRRGGSAGEDGAWSVAGPWPVAARSWEDPGLRRLAALRPVANLSDRAGAAAAASPSVLWTPEAQAARLETAPDVGRLAVWDDPALEAALASAREAFEEDRLYRPRGANAYEALLAARARAATDPRVLAQLDRLERLVRRRADLALAQGRFEDFYAVNALLDRIRARRPL